ncbi:DUF4254 domain-containing protein [Nocardia flavorosea]|uniref:DUF4254 domain-containing protein n=1 Tax=Nocardia flavorosea TaxID=53429 RepID=UPI001E342344|nr:DUF4254 domain-containing protein [Nocardia flavorosea]
MFGQSVMVPGDVRTGRQVAPPWGGLPTATQLLCSFQGTKFADHELLRSAHALAALHARRITMQDSRLVAEMDQRRRELIEDIDEWFHERGPRLLDGLIHTETLGAVIDRLAWRWVDANQMVETDGARDQYARKRWHRLAELIDGYTELAGDIVGGRRRFPGRM